MVERRSSPTFPLIGKTNSSPGVLSESQDARETDSSDSGGSVFITQTPAGTERRATHASKHDNPQRLFNFPFLPRKHRVPTRERHHLHKAVMGGFFKCVRVKSQRGEGQESALPTSDLSDEGLSELLEEEENRPDEVGFKVVEKKCFLVATKTKSRHPWWGQRPGQERIQAGRAEEGDAPRSGLGTMQETPADAPTSSHRGRDLIERTQGDVREMHDAEESEESDGGDEGISPWQTGRGNEPPRDTDSDATLCDYVISQEVSYRGRKSPETRIPPETAVLHTVDQIDQMEHFPSSQSRIRSLRHLRHDSASEGDHVREGEESSQRQGELEGELESSPVLFDDSQVESQTVLKSRRLELMSHILHVEGEGDKSAGERVAPEGIEISKDTVKSVLSESCGVDNGNEKREVINDSVDAIVSDDDETQILNAGIVEEGAALGSLQRLTAEFEKSVKEIGNTAAAVETSKSSRARGKEHVHQSPPNESDQDRDEQVAQSAEASMKIHKVHHHRGEEEEDGPISKEPESPHSPKSVAVEEEVSQRKKEKMHRVHDGGRGDDRQQEEAEGLSAPPVSVEKEASPKKKRDRNGSVGERENGLVSKEPESPPAAVSVTVEEDVSPKKKRCKAQGGGREQPEALPDPPMSVEEEVSPKKKKKKYKIHDGGGEEKHSQRQEDPEGLSAPRVSMEKEVSPKKKKKHEINRSVEEQEDGLISREPVRPPVTKSVTSEEEASPKKKHKVHDRGPEDLPAPLVNVDYEVSPKKKKKHKVHHREEGNHDQRQEEPEVPLKKKKKKHMHDGGGGGENHDAPPVIVEDEVHLKKKKHKQKVNDGGRQHDERQEEPESVIYLSPSQRKRKKREKVPDGGGGGEDEEPEGLHGPPVRLKKEESWKKKRTTLEEHDQRQEEETLQKKKKKRKETPESVDVTSFPGENNLVELERVAQGSVDDAVEQVTKKKKKKGRKMQTCNLEGEEAQSVDSVSVRKKEKKGTSSFLDADAGESWAAMRNWTKHF